MGSIAVLGPAPGCCGLQVISPLQACTHPGSTQGLWVEGFDQGNACLLGGGQSIRGPKLLLLLSLAALGELLRDIVGGGCCQGLEVAGSRSRGLESTEEGGPKGPDSSGRIRQEDLGSSHRPAPYCMHVGLVTKSCLTCNPMDRSLPGSSVHGILQASILGWVAISFFRGSS